MPIRDLAARLARLAGSPPIGATTDEIHLLSHALGFRPPQDLNHWLSICRGVSLPRGCVACLLGTHRPLDIPSAILPQWRAHRWIPIANDGCGQHYCLLADRDPAPVAFFEDTAPDEPQYLVASGLFSFLDMALAAEEHDTEPAWSKPDAFFAADPAAAKIVQVPFSWDA